MTNSNNLERSPPPSTVSPGQGLGAPDSAGKAVRAGQPGKRGQGLEGRLRTIQGRSGTVGTGQFSSNLVPNLSLTDGRNGRKAPQRPLSQPGP